MKKRKYVILRGYRLHSVNEGNTMQTKLKGFAIKRVAVEATHIKRSSTRKLKAVRRK